MSLPDWLKPIYTSLNQEGAQRGHSFLLLGPSGLGQSLLIDAVVSHWLQVNALQDHPDVMRIARLEGKRDIAVDQIRELILWTQQTSHGHFGRVAIIEQCELMNPSTANSLLKTLEEPPTGVRFILTASRAGKLLPTILSRCQRVVLPTPETGLALNWLRAKVKSASDYECQLALSFHQGAPLAAEEWLVGEGLGRWREWESWWQQALSARRCSVAMADWGRKEFDVFCRQLVYQCAIDGKDLTHASAWQLIRLAWQAEQGIRQNLSKDILCDNLIMAINQYLQGRWPQLSLTSRRGALA